jgi:hypothetical protein
MKFDDLDTKMRVYETAHDHCVLPGLYMVFYFLLPASCSRFSTSKLSLEEST